MHWRSSHSTQCLFNRKTICTQKNMLKKCTEYKTKYWTLPLQSNHQNYILRGSTAQNDSSPHSSFWLTLAENSIGHFLFRKKENAQAITCEVTAKNKGGWNPSTKLLQWSRNSSNQIPGYISGPTIEAAVPPQQKWEIHARRCQLSFSLKYFSISYTEGHFALQWW